jgi:hypothetical protein
LNRRLGRHSPLDHSGPRGKRTSRRPLPFGHILAFQASPGQDGRTLSPVCVYHPDRDVASQSCHDRITGEPIDADSLLTYADVLGPFQFRPEHKLLNAQHRDVGVTQRRRIVVEFVDRIGKESHREDERSLGHDVATVQEYSSSPNDTELLLEQVRAGCKEVNMTAVAIAAGADPSKLSRMLRGKSPPTVSVLLELLEAIDELRTEKHRRESLAVEALEHIRALVQSTTH